MKEIYKDVIIMGYQFIGGLILFLLLLDTYYPYLNALPFKTSKLIVGCFFGACFYGQILLQRLY